MGFRKFWPAATMTRYASGAGARPGKDLDASSGLLAAQPLSEEDRKLLAR